MPYPPMQTPSTRTQATEQGLPVFSVGNLNTRAKQLLEQTFSLVWVEGELSNFSRPSSGHWYFTLKDAQAQVRCAMFRNRNQSVQTLPKAGDKVRVKAKVSLYEGRGDYQLIVEHLKPAGAGSLQQQFEQLKSKLTQEGLTQLSRKKNLPSYPYRVGVVSSLSGAAIQDVLSVFRRRSPWIQLFLLDAPVQGSEAPQALTNALKAADGMQFDVILLCRGGGSIEDLWAFNDETLARTIAHLRTPIVSGVGHETDFTIADFVADIRAPTPSAAAELIGPNKIALLNQLNDLYQRLNHSIAHQLKHKKHQLMIQHHRLKHPGEQLQSWAQRLDQLELRLHHAQAHRLAPLKTRIEHITNRLQQAPIKNRLTEAQKHLANLSTRHHQSVNITLHNKRMHFQRLIEKLHIVSPLSTLTRGYTITKDEHGAILRTQGDVSPGQKIITQFGDGEIISEVQSPSKGVSS